MLKYCSNTPIWRTYYILIYTSGLCIGSMPSSIQKFLQYISDSYSKLGQRVPAKDAEFMVFTKKYKVPPFHLSIYKINSTELTSSNTLGILTKKCSKRRSTWWGAHPSQLLLIFKATISDPLWNTVLVFYNIFQEQTCCNFNESNGDQ